MNRRGLLSAILAAGMAPAFVKAGVLMPIKTIWTPPPIYIEMGNETWTGADEYGNPILEEPGAGFGGWLQREIDSVSASGDGIILLRQDAKPTGPVILPANVQLSGPNHRGAVRFTARVANSFGTP